MSILQGDTKGQNIAHNNNFNRRVNKRKDMPSKFGYAIDVGRHQSHNLRLAREVVFVFLLVRLRARDRWGLGRIRRRCRVRRGGDVFADKRFGEEDGIELNADSDLEGRC